jgi:hypothetical protein
MCHALREKQVENSIRILLVMAKKGALSSGLKILEKLQEAGNSVSIRRKQTGTHRHHPL